MRKLTLVAMAAVAAALIVPHSVEAQRGGAGMRSGGQGMMGGGPGGGQRQLSPGMLLRQSQALDLTDQQVSQLTELRDGLEAAGREVQEGMEGHRERMAELLEADQADLDAIREEFAGNHAAMSQFRWAQIEAGVQARNLLTDEQRGIVQGWGQARGAMMGSRGQRGTNRGIRGGNRGSRGMGSMRGARGNRRFRP